MQTINLTYTDKKSLKSFIKSHQLDNNKSILVQIFTGIVEKEFIEELISQILSILPTAKIIGSTSDGIINNNSVIQRDTLISFSTFKTTKIEIFISKDFKDSYTLGENLASQFPKDKNLKVAICFSDGLNTNGEEFLKGIEKINKEIVVAGGMAGDNGDFKNSFVFSNNGITSNGAVMAILYGDDLIVHTNYYFGWRNVGKNLTITKSDKNRVYTIDGISAVDIYKKYLGNNVVIKLPATGIEFPLIMNKKNGDQIARAVLKKHNDGSLSFAGNVPMDTKVQFGYGNIKSISFQRNKTVKILKKYPIESIFVYSCMARRRLLRKNIYNELNSYTTMAPATGFFTYGEFYHYSNNNDNNDNNNELFNQTATILTLSENSIFKESNIEPLSNDNYSDEFTDTIDALSHLISQTSYELMELNFNQKLIIQEELTKNRQKEQLLMQQSKLASMGDMIGMIAHQWRQPLNAISSVATSLLLKNQLNILDKEILDTKLNDINKYTQHLSSTITDFMDFFKPDKEKEFVDIKNIIASVEGIIFDSFNYHNIELIINIEDDIAPFLSYENELRQVILNLAKNSKEAIVLNKIQNGLIKIDAYQNDQFIFIDIKDNGGGIQEKITNKVFEPYFTTKDKDGIGIGLYMSKTIIEEHLQGLLKFENKNDGVVFTIQLKGKYGK